MDINISGNLGKYLKSIREKNNLTQVDLAKSADVSVRHYQDIEYGLINCRIDTLEKILTIYKLNIFNFFELHIIEEFYKFGTPILKQLFEKKLYSTCVVNADGVITQMCSEFEILIGNTFEKLKEPLHFWDVCFHDNERLYLKHLYPLFKQIRPHPAPWVGYIKSMSEEGKKRIRLYWRATTDSEAQFSGLELVVFGFE